MNLSSHPSETGPATGSETPIRTGTPLLQARRRRIFLRTVALLTSLLVLLCVVGFFAGRHWVRQVLSDSLPQLDGSIAIAGLAAPVSVQRDNHGMPHLRAASLDDLVLAQGYITAQDRLWQMDALRRHAAGELAEILGSSLIPHDRTQRILQLRAAADRVAASLPADQLHLLQRYADGVNASIATQRPNLPLEFRLLRYQPTPWTPRDSILVGLVMFQDLTNSFPDELNREALTARLPQDLIADLYPVTTWRDHPPAQASVDVTAPQTDVPNIPLDKSQTRFRTPPYEPEPRERIRLRTAPARPPRRVSTSYAESPSGRTALPADLLAAEAILAPVLTTAPQCDGCKAGSNDWVVSGAHTASGKPLLSNDMHLAHNVPGIWYAADLECPAAAGNFHVTGVSLPGVPFIIAGHNEHVAWGFTNLGAQVQDVAVEHIRGNGATAEYEAANGAWRPVLHQQETIHVKSGRDVLLEVQATHHGASPAPIISPLFPTEKRTLSLRWTIYDPGNISPSFFAINAASDGATLVSAFAAYGGPSQNLVYADDQGHIGYHAIGAVPIRGSLTAPSPISPVPADALDTTQDWVGSIPYEKLPQANDPANGFLATANNRVVPDDYPYPITLDWGAPYRNERIWKLLAGRASASKDHLTPADMLAIQTDVYSNLDHVLAQRLAYAIDHTALAEFAPGRLEGKRMHQAADILRDWNGSVDLAASAPAIVDATRSALWSLLIDTHAQAHAETQPDSNPSANPPPDLAALYRWGNKPYTEEWLIMHTPSRWLPAKYATWDDLLAAAVSLGLREAKSPYDLSKWHYGEVYPIDIEHPIYSRSPLLQRLIGRPTGTGVLPQSGDGSTVKQVGRSFGPSERFTADLSDLDHSTLNLVFGESSNPASAWFMDQWPAWYRGTTFTLPFRHAAVDAMTTHTLTLSPR